MPSTIRKYWSVAALGFFSLTLQANSHFNKFTPEAEYVAGELIIKLRDGVNISEIDALQKGLFTEGRKIKTSFGNYFVVKMDNKSSIQSLISMVNRDKNVLFAEPNFIYRSIFL